MGIGIFGGIAAIVGLFLVARKDKKKPEKEGKVVITYDTPLIEIQTPTDPLMIRRMVKANALSVIGLSASDHRLQFEKLLGPPGPPNYEWDLNRPFRAWKDDEGNYHTEGVSTCGLVAEGIQRRCGSKCETLYQPYDYKGAKAAIARFIQCALSWNAWTYGSEKRPGVGDYVVIGKGIRTHALTIIRWEGDTCVSVDGGQVGQDGLQMVRLVKRNWANGKLNGRKLYGYADCTKCHYGPTALVPKTWKKVKV